MNITVIYNPNSTGDSEHNARLVYEMLKTDNNIELLATESAGHAEEIASRITEKGRPAMIISSSGDGGYHEVLNGVLSSRHHAKITLGLLPSGNANDHYRSLHRGDLATRIKQKDIDQIDIIKVSTDNFTRYAHSYVGFGVTAKIGSQLNKTKLNPVKEIWLVLRHLFDYTPVKIEFESKIRRYDNLLFTNIGNMSKVLKINQNAEYTDGQLEVTAKRSGNALGLVSQLLKAAVVGLDQSKQLQSISFKILNTTQVQLDGEIYEIKAGQTVKVECLSKALSCII